LAGVAIVAGARRRLGEAEFEARRRRRDLVEDRERGGHDLRPDAVAGQDGDVEAVVGEHGKVSRVLSKTRRMILPQRVPQAPPLPASGESIGGLRPSFLGTKNAATHRLWREACRPSRTLL